MARRLWHSRDAHALCAYTGIADPPTAIRYLASKLIDRVGFQAPPFEPEVIASFQGVYDVRRVEMQNAGRLRPTGEGLVIEVNASHSTGKQNLTINHETTHTLLPTYDGRAIFDFQTGIFDKEGKEEELLCDIGGAALLLDIRWLQSVAREVGPSLATLTHAAQLFGSSLQAAAWQLSSVMQWPCAFVMWEPGLRKAERKLASAKLLPLFEDLGGPKTKWRVAHAYPTSTFDSFIPWNKSTDCELVSNCCEQEPFTYGRAEFDFYPKSVYCENVYAPYRTSEGIRKRIVSFIHADSRESDLAATVPFALLEAL